MDDRKPLTVHIEPNECLYCRTKSIVFEKNRDSIENMKCQRCGRRFPIDWSSDKPRPIFLDTSMLLRMKLTDYHLKNL